MAKLLGPLMSAEARGRVGGLVYNTWRGIRYCKAKTGPAQPRTQLQLQMRSWAVMLARLWQTLTPTNRSNWNAYAVSHTEVDWTGSPVRLTGLNWFIRCNTRLLEMAMPTIADPPTDPAPGAPLAFAAANGAGQSILTWTPTAGTDISFEVFKQGPHSNGLLGKLEKSKRYGHISGETGTLTISSLLAGLFTFFVRMIDEGTGLASPWVSDTATVT